ncbi:MAG: photosynthetic complex assembly protein PuhC [Burkholderiaceae bacterium]|jgi:putative photosynthetic complex assembly protein|nr:photosynthetic complex assembly protein PuhC [Burkholderiaceae bacterium]
MSHVYTGRSRPAPGADTFPRWVLFCAGGILALSLISVGLVRLTGNGPDQLAAAPTAQRSLVFLDSQDGGVRVEDGATGQMLTVLHGEQGFVRGALRALSRERYARGIGSSQPFDLIARVDGRLTLLDPATGQTVDLESFGPTNAGQFRQFLHMQAN